MPKETAKSLVKAFLPLEARGGKEPSIQQHSVKTSLQQSLLGGGASHLPKYHITSQLLHNLSLQGYSQGQKAMHKQKTYEWDGMNPSSSSGRKEKEHTMFKQLLFSRH